MANYLLQQLIPYIYFGTIEQSIHPRIRVLTALSFFATWTYQRIIGLNYHLSVSQSAISYIIHEVSSLIVRIMAEFGLSCHEHKDRYFDIFLGSFDRAKNSSSHERETNRICIFGKKLHHFEKYFGSFYEIVTTASSTIHHSWKKKFQPNGETRVPLFWV